MGDDGDTGLGVPDDDGVPGDARHQDPVPVGGDPDGGGGAGLGHGQLPGPAHGVVHLGVRDGDLQM